MNGFGIKVFSMLLFVLLNLKNSKAFHYLECYSCCCLARMLLDSTLVICFDECTEFFVKNMHVSRFFAVFLWCQ